MRMKISCPLTLALSHQGAREKRTKEFRVPSPLMGEGEDEGESPEQSEILVSCSKRITLKNVLVFSG
jgi:hypothetical protein